MVERNAESHEQVNACVNDHCRTGERNIREDCKLGKRSGQWRFHFEGGSTPDSLGWHHKAGNDAHHGYSRTFRETAHLFKPAAHEGEPVETKDHDAVGQRGKPGSTCKSD